MAEKLRPRHIKNSPRQTLTILSKLQPEKLLNYIFHVEGSNGDDTWICNSGAPKWYTWGQSMFMDFKPLNEKNP
jgi:hypothetical protein